MSATSADPFRRSLIAAGGETGRLIATFDWSSTTVGPMDGWPQSLKTAVGMILPSPVPIVMLWGTQGVMLYNDAYSAFAGGRHPALLGSNVREGWPEVSEFNDNVMKVCLGGGTLAYRGQELTLHRHGRPERVWMNLNYSPVMGEDGRPAGVLAIVVEVTERVAAEQRREAAEAALRAERDRSQRVLDNMGEAFVFLDREFRIVDMNAEAMRLEKRPKEAILGKTHWEAHPEAAPELGELYRQAMREQRAVSLEHHHVWPDGRDTWIDMRAYPVGDGLAVFYRDVTERKLTQVALAEQERELRTLTDALPVLVSYVDAERRYRFNNKVYETWFPRRREDIVGRPVREVVGEAAYAKVAHHMDAALRGERVRFSQFMPYADTAGRHIEVEYIPRQAPDGRIEGFYTLVQDVTARKATEDALREAQAAAEAQAVERSAILGQIAEGVIVADQSGRISFVNEAAKRIHGVAQLDVEPGQYADVYHLLTEQGEPFPSHRLPLARAVLNGETVNDARWCVRRPDGSEVLAVGSARPVLDTSGHQIGAVLTLRDETARDATERSLRESEARVRALTDNLPSGMVYQIATGRDGSERRFLYVSQSHEKLTGVPAEAVLADPSLPYKLIVPEDQPRLVEAEVSALRDGTPFDVQVRFRRTDGEVRWSRILSAAREQPDGSLVWDGIQIDITEERETADALRESEARLRLISDAAPQIVWISDRQGRMEFLNRQFVQYTGSASEMWTAAEMAERFMHPDDGPIVVEAFAAALRTGNPFEIEHRIRSAAGEYRWFLARAEPYHDPETGEIVRWFGVSVDIHDRKLAEARLREINETLELRVAERTAERDRLWTLSEDMLARADYQGMMSAVSPAWTRVLGWSEEELLSRPYSSFMHPDDTEVSLSALTRMGTTGQPTRFENRIATSDGTWKPIEWIVAPEPDSPHFIAVGRDLSEVKAQEEDLRLAQEALRQSQKMEAMGQLTGGVAHDFNNLLTPIIGSLDRLLRRGVGSEREQRLMDGALQSAERAKTLVQRLLAFARRQPLQPTAVDLTELVGGMADLIGSTSGPRVEVRVEMSADLPPALADANQIEMAILNLAVNARDAMPDGGVLTISAERESVRGPHPAKLRHGHYVRLSVKDTGLGMDEATLARAVEPFFSTKGVGKGTGLGLSMVHGLAEQLHGGLTITSTPGQGTTASLWLPISPFAAEQDQKERSPSAPRTEGTALLVDDEDLVRMSTADMLMDLGYEVVEANSAEEALKMVDEGLHPDLVVTDHLMPGRSGIDLARDLRSRRPNLPVLIVSGFAEVEGIAPGFPRLTKPFRQTELAESLATIVPSPEE